MEIPKIVNELPDAPKDVMDWILKDVVEGRYMIYSTKEDRAVCTYCGKVFVPSRGDLVPVPKNNAKITCPCCKANAVYKSKGIGRSNLTEMTRVMILTKRGKSIFLTVSEIDILFKEEKPEIFKWMSGVYKFDSKIQTSFKHIAGWYREERWQEMKNIRVIGCPRGWFENKRQGLYVYDKNFDRIFKNTDLKYADVADVYRNKRLTGEELLRYLYLSAKFQSIEILRKTGFWHLIEQKINEDGGSRAINWKATDLKKIFKLNRNQIKEVRDAKLDLLDLELYKKQIKKGEPVNPEQAKLIRRYASPYKSKGIEDFTTLARASAYILNQNIKAQDKKHLLRLNDYSDYLIECETLGYNLEDKKTMYPKVFAKAHSEASKQIRERKEEIDQQQFTKTQLALTKMTEPYIVDGLMIIPAASEKELRAEGESLGHCVGGYGAKVARGESAILFVRKANAPQKSYYTLELSKNKSIIQCRGKANCGKTPEVEEFINKWLDEVILKKKKRKVA